MYSERPPYDPDYVVDESPVEYEIEPWWQRVPRLYWVLGALAIAGFFGWWSNRPLAPCGPYPVPRQTNLSAEKSLPAPSGMHIFGLAEYEVDALVLSRARYWFDGASAVSPVDVALAWGPLTSADALTKIRYRQSDRWFWFNWERGSSYNAVSIAASAANTHIIPPQDDPYVAKQIMKIRRGDHVRLKGYLVRVEGDNGFRWRSSLTRSDTGDGSCEVLYVTDVEWID